MFQSIDQIDQWHMERRGRFTSSEIYKLLSKGVGGEMFGVGAINYIKKKAIEKITDMWERPELEFVKSLLHGKMYEAPAFDHYQRTTHNYQMKYFGSETPVFIPYDEDSGGSPDALMGEGERIIWGAEVKCPKDPAVHIEHRNMKHQYDLEKVNLQYYSQIQHLLFGTKSEGWHFFSYDDRFSSPKMKGYTLDVLPDRKFQDNLEIRVRMAVKRRDQMVEEMLNT